jgi:glycosyltransferase involved in cell wall biosynthesis
MRLLIHDYAGHPLQVQLSRELARRGHAVIHAFAGGLLTPRGSLAKKADDPRTLELLEVPMDPNYRRDKYRFLRRRHMEVDYGQAIATLIAERLPNIVISANTPTEPQLRIANTCSRLGIYFVPWIQDFYSVAVARFARKKLPIIGNLIGWWYRHLEIRTLGQASAVVAITDDFVPMLRQCGVPQEKITVIPNWAPLDELPQQPRRNAWSDAHGLNDKFVFLYSGTLAMKHNPDLLRQLAIAFRNDSEVRIVVISEGPGADYLRKHKEIERLGNLAILPFQNFARMPDVLASADVLLAVLEADAGIFSVPSKVLTYHCAGKPILAAMPSGNLAARIIMGEGSGTCVDPGEINDFIDAAKNLYGDSSVRERNGMAARSYAERNFNIEIITDQFEKCALRNAVGTGLDGKGSALAALSLK